MYNGQWVVDGHADILYRMEGEGLGFYDPDSKLQQSFSHMAASRIDVQVFVTFVEPSLTPGEQLYKVLASLDRFYREVEKPGAIAPIFSVHDLQAVLQSGQRAALLSLEGADALNGQIGVLHALFRLGVRLIGLTWNGANSVADGVGEARGAGLSQFGRDVVRTMRSLGMVVDVSHLAERGVWDVLDMYGGPVVASHSNAAAVHAHRRNLSDDQVRGIAATGGIVGATFVPGFIGDKNVLDSEDLLRHIDHLLTVAGPDGVALGSDFDGIDTTLADLRNGSDYPLLLEKLERRYGAEVLAKVAGGNWLRVFSQILPAQ
ncbi:MAG: dipeptidase [Bacilli bacterium]